METPENNAQPMQNRWSGLGTRTVSAIVLGVIAFLCVWCGGILFAAFIMLLALIMKKEWDALIPPQALTLRAAGYVYVVLPSASLLWLRDLPQGLAATLALVAMISATDIGAYMIGRRFGKHKLAPTISPGKTWEGLAGGIAAAIVTALALSLALAVFHPFGKAFFIGVFVALLAQAGDLFESAIKRQANVKDSGTLLPGHGGLLDRLDGYMLVSPVFAIIVHYAYQ